jgi:hypothetical protein
LESIGQTKTHLEVKQLIAEVCFHSRYWTGLFRSFLLHDRLTLLVKERLISRIL